MWSGAGARSSGRVGMVQGGGVGVGVWSGRGGAGVSGPRGAGDRRVRVTRAAGGHQPTEASGLCDERVDA